MWGSNWVQCLPASVIVTLTLIGVLIGTVTRLLLSGVAHVFERKSHCCNERDPGVCDSHFQRIGQKDALLMPLFIFFMEKGG